MGDNIIKFPANYGGLYISKPDKILFSKVSEDNKMKMVEGLNNLQK